MAIVYIYVQFKNLRQLGSKYILGEFLSLQLIYCDLFPNKIGYLTRQDKKKIYKLLDVLYIISDCSR